MGAEVGYIIVTIVVAALILTCILATIRYRKAKNRKRQITDIRISTLQNVYFQQTPQQLAVSAPPGRYHDVSHGVNIMHPTAVTVIPRAVTSSYGDGAFSPAHAGQGYGKPPGRFIT